MDTWRKKAGVALLFLQKERKTIMTQIDLKQLGIKTLREILTSKDVERLVAALKEKGMEVTKEEAKKALEEFLLNLSDVKKLNDDEASKVVGGYYGTDAYIRWP